MKYKAFISYRHIEPDMTIAKKLHALIETYKIPRNVKASKNIAQIGKVFRDEEELPTSTNLSDDITEALKNSEWLIVVCTPDLLKSRWCMQEINTFIELGKRDHILTVLLSGTPEESFPEQLKYIEREGKVVEAEPLAANIVAPNTIKSINKLRIEKLRLIAPMLGVSFDDLKQRERERKIKRRLALSLTVIVLLVAFLSYAFVQNVRIQSEKTTALISQSEYLADASNSALRNGDRMLALMLALEALPQNFDKPEKPIVESAVEALRKAVIYGVGSDSYVKVTDIEYESVDSSVYSDKDTIYIFGDAKPYVQSFDIHTGKDTSDNLEYGFDDYPGRVFMDERMRPIMISGTSASSISLNYSITDMNIPNEMGSIYGVGFNAASDIRAFYGKNRIYLWNNFNYKGIVNLPEYCTVDMITPDMYVGTSVRQSDEVVYLLNSGYTNSDDTGHIAMTFRVPYDRLGMKSDTNFYCKSLDVTKDHRLIAYVGGPSQINASHLILWNGENGNYVGNLNAKDYLGEANSSYFVSAEFAPKENDYRLAITTGNGSCFIYDCMLERSLWLDNGKYSIISAHFNSDGSKVLCSDKSNGLIFDAMTGELLDVLPTEFEIRDAVFADTNVYGDSVYDMAVLLKGRRGLTIYKVGVDDVDSVFNAAVVLDQIPNMPRIKNCDFSSDKTKLFVPTGTGIYIFDTKTGKQIGMIEDSSMKVICTADGKLYAFNNVVKEEDSRIKIYSSESLDLLVSNQPEYVHTIDPNNSFSYISEYFSSDSEVLLVTSKEDNKTGETRICKTGIFAFDASSLEELWQVVIDDGMDLDNRFFDEAKDWGGAISIDAFVKGEMVTIFYRYGGYGLIAEVRNVKSGEVVNKYILSDSKTKVTILNSKTISESVDMVSSEFGQFAYYIKSDLGEKYERRLCLANLYDGSLIKMVDLDDCCAVKWINKDNLCLFPKYENSEYVYIWNVPNDTITKVSYDSVQDNFETSVWPRIQSIGYDNYAIIKDATPKQIAEAAKAILRGRQLNEYQRKKYHIEK